MPTDPGRALQEQVIAGMDVRARGAARLRLSARARLLAWRQADEGGAMSNIARAEFILRRLYPTLPESAPRQVLAQLVKAEATGEWHGFRRPEEMPPG